jgi:hypothetical protein
MTDTPTRWLPMAEAAAAMGISIRTLQRRAKAGEVRSMPRGRNVMIALDDMATDGGQAGELTRLIKHVEVTERMSMAAMTVIERERDRLAGELSQVRRRGRIAVAVAVAASMAAAAGITFALATDRHNTDMADRIEAIKTELAAETACRIEAESDRDKLAAAVADDLLLMADR